MPVYEYKCNGCEKPVSIYFKTFSSAETSEPVCPECKSTALERKISRVYFGGVGSFANTWGTSSGMPDLASMDHMNADDRNVLQEYGARVKEQMMTERAGWSDIGMPQTPPTSSSDSD